MQTFYSNSYIVPQVASKWISTKNTSWHCAGYYIFKFFFLGICCVVTPQTGSRVFKSCRKRGIFPQPTRPQKSIWPLNQQKSHAPWCRGKPADPRSEDRKTRNPTLLLVVEIGSSSVLQQCVNETDCKALWALNLSTKEQFMYIWRAECILYRRHKLIDKVNSQSGLRTRCAVNEQNKTCRVSPKTVVKTTNELWKAPLFTICHQLEVCSIVL